MGQNRQLYIVRAANAVFERGSAYCRNRRLDKAFLSEQESYLARIDAAVSRGVDWFVPEQDLTMSALFILERVFTAGLEPRLAYINDKIAHYRATIRDPALRLFDRDYDPAAPSISHIPDVMDVRPYQYVEQLMLKAVCADQHQLDEAFLHQLEAVDDGGGYGTTHIVAAGMILKRFSTIPAERLDAMMRKCIPSMVRRNRTNYAGDQFCERIVMLQWLDRHDLVPPAWILRLLEVQNPDGGWQARGVPPEGRSNQHTTCLAIAVLAQFRQYWRGHRLTAS